MWSVDMSWISLTTSNGALEIEVIPSSIPPLWNYSSITHPAFSSQNYSTTQNGNTGITIPGQQFVATNGLSFIIGPSDTGDNDDMLKFDMDAKTFRDHTTYSFKVPGGAKESCVVTNGLDVYVIGGQYYNESALGGFQYIDKTQIYSLEHDRWTYGGNI